MRRWSKAGWFFLVFFAAGCTKSDADILAGITRKIADRGRSLSGQVEAKMQNSLAVEMRVKNRLRWDKTLAEAAIEVHATDNGLELKGTVNSPEQVRRAIALAESTAGVERVVNSLRVSE